MAAVALERSLGSHQRLLPSGLRRLGQSWVEHSCYYNEPLWLGQMSPGQEGSSDHGYLSWTRLLLFSVQ